ncbi:MAG TPA: YfiR family protein [Opitutaceae bacterium]|nr:YfiR family protein [Opitutaceae bacterium]
METLTRYLRASLLALIVLGASRPAQAEAPHSEAELTAVFLFNFGSFVEWPAAAMPENGEPFRIGVCGATEVAHALESVVAGERIRGHTIEVVRVRHRAEAQHCQILFIPPGDESIVPPNMLEERPILTVGESDRFEAEGGMVRFLPERNRLRLRINLDPVKRAGLRINSQLLRIAETRGGT